MPKPLDLTGQRFGNLIALSKAPSKSGKTYWTCKCDCGEIKDIQTGHLTGGITKSCGCLSHIKSDKSKKVIDFRKRIKVALVEAFGHKCAYCGLQDEPYIYDFHHLIPEEKTFGISNASTTRSRQAYADEAKKCVLLCSNCHRKIENKSISEKDLKIINFDEQKYYDTLKKLLK